MENLKQDIQFFEETLSNYAFPAEPTGLFEPVEYLLNIGGKRIRPVLLLAVAKLLNGNVDSAIPAALAVELFHNFSLMHDDIMDQALVRRGKPTVHQKYNTNTAILSGDVMLIYAYKLLLTLPDIYSIEANKIFTKMAEEVCVGQQMDMDFETSDHVEIMDYLKMIELKTSVLIGASLQLGGLISGMNAKDLFHLYEFGKNVGIAFQIQDDLLDTFGNADTFGKKIGGDILNNKKTYLYLKSLQLLDKSDTEALKELFSKQSIHDEEKIETVKSLYKKAHVQVYADELKNEYKGLAMSHLHAVGSFDDAAKLYFQKFSDYLIKREL